MPKKLFTVLLVIIMVGFAGRLVYGSQPVKIIVNDREIKNTQGVTIIEGSTMVPLRLIAETLGATVKWDGTSRTVYISNKKEAQPLVKINGELTTWPYWIKDGRLYLEYRNAVQLVREALNGPQHMVHYSPSSTTLYIDNKAIPLSLNKEGDYQIVSVDYLRDLGLINYTWDTGSGNLTLQPR